MIASDDITGLVLAGGRGSRMGGVDKGLLAYQGLPLALHMARRLAPQVGAVALNANRHAEAYAAFGLPVWRDTVPEQPGPLAGFLAGLVHCATPYLVTVPCDSPRFPADLVARLAQALAVQDAQLALAAGPDPQGEIRPQPVFCLMRVEVADSLARFIASGQGKIGLWAASLRRAVVPFDRPGDDPLAFANANTADELQRLQHA